MSKFPEQPKPPILLAMSTDENSAWLKAHSWAYVSILAALKRVEEAADPASNDYAHWFELEWLWTARADWSRRRQVVIDSLNKMAARMSSTSVIYEKSSDMTSCLQSALLKDQRRLAVAYLNEPRKIGLCPNAFDVDWLRFVFWDSEEWARAFIVAHENYHVAVNTTQQDAETADSYYNFSLCKQLSAFRPELAIRNAQNYAYFVMGAMWSRPAKAPAWLPDYGIWNVQTPGIDWGSTTGGPVLAAVSGPKQAALLAWLEPEANGARLWARLMVEERGRLVAHEARPFDALSSSPQGADCVSLVAPTLAADGQDVYCAYVDKLSKKLVAKKAQLGGVLGAGGRLAPRWEDIGMTPEGGSDEPTIYPPSMTSPSPAFAVYRSGKGKISFGLYCVYIDGRNELKCIAKLDEVRSRWHHLPFDRRRESTLSPSLVAFDGQLTCGYVDGQTGRLTLLNHLPATKAPHFHDAAPGTWQADRHPALAIEAQRVSLATLDTTDGLRLVAVGNTPGKDGNVSCAVYSQETGWTPVTRLTTLSSTHRPALALIGSQLHLLCRNPDGSLQARRAN